MTSLTMVFLISGVITSICDDISISNEIRETDPLPQCMITCQENNLGLSTITGIAKAQDIWVNQAQLGEIILFWP